MLILHGIYFFKRKIVAYRNDFCLSCQAPRISYQTRSFDVLHLFFIPVLPLGFWHHWQCSLCGRNPHVHPHTRKGFKWAGVVVLAIFAAAAWLPGFGDKDGPGVVWLMRIGFPIALIFALWHTINSKPDLNLADKLKDINTAPDSVCPLCHRPLVLGPRCHCVYCGIEKKEVHA